MSVLEIVARLYENAGDEDSLLRLAELAQLDPAKDFEGADLRELDVAGEDLRRFSFRGADLRGSNLRGAKVDRGALVGARLEGADLSDVQWDNVFEFYSCFISYSAQDEAFARRLHSDLEAYGVRCWFAPTDLKIGGHLETEIDTAIRKSDRIVLILSQASVDSPWFRKEVEIALEEEAKFDKIVLVPVSLDDAVFTTTDPWAAEIVRNRKILRFSDWRTSGMYHSDVVRLLGGLRLGSEE